MVWPNGDSGSMNLVEAPDSALMVALLPGLATCLVRQWRHAWGQTSWEVPAGTLEPGEDPLAGARRELVEEAGLEGGEWTSLGAVRPSAVVSATQHLYLVRNPEPTARRPEAYERDMIVRHLPLAWALDAALKGEIFHSGSIVALIRAGRHLGLAPAPGAGSGSESHASS